MRNELILISMLMCTVMPAEAGVSVSIGINLAQYPELIPVPGYPVYYAPELETNYFFYDGKYWVYADDNWYDSSWYNGPWQLIDPEFVPVYVLRIPVQYYRRPPIYFRSWLADESPHWGEYWGNDWSRHHQGWDHWKHNAVPARASLPVYQRQYTGNQYPQAAQQQRLQSNNNPHQAQHSTVQPSNQPSQPRNAPLNNRPAMQPPPQNSNIESHVNERDSRRQPTQQHASVVPHLAVPPQARERVPRPMPDHARPQTNDAPREQQRPPSEQRTPPPPANNEHAPAPRPEPMPAPRRERNSEQNSDHHGGDDHDHRQ